MKPSKTQRGAGPRPPLSPALAIGLVLSAFAGVTPSAFGDTRVRETRVCPDVIARFEESGTKSNDAEALKRSAHCLFEANRFQDAARAFEQANALEPHPELLLALAIARFHGDDFDGARAALQGLDEALAARADFHLYRGLLLREGGAHAEAARALDRARRVDPGAVEPVASFHAAKSWRALGDDKRALEAFRRIESDWLGTPWSAQARRQIEDLTGQWPRRFWLSGELGLERDDNVVLRNRGVQLPSEISDQRDWRGMWRLRGATELTRRWGWSTGAALSYEGSAHFDLETFDLQYPSLTLWADRSLQEGQRLRFRYDYGFAWLDTESYLSSHEIGAGIEHVWKRWGTSELSVAGRAHDFRFSNLDVANGSGAVGSPCPVGSVLCGPAGLDEEKERDRDGLGLLADLDHRLGIPAFRGDLRVGYRLESYSADGREYRFVGHEARTSLSLELLHDVSATVSGRFRHRDFRHPSTFPEPDRLFQGFQYGLSSTDRRDRAYEFGIELERPVVSGITLGARWRFRRNRSNVSVFDYRHQIVGFYLRFDSTGLWPW